MIRKFFYALIGVCLIVACATNSKDEIKEVDVCVYGGTSAGVVAAYSAKQMGKTVLLIEPGKYLGGMSTGGLGSTDIGNKYAVTGLARLFYRRIGEQYKQFEQWMFPPSAASKAMQCFVTDGELDVLYGYRIVSLKTVNAKINSILLEKSNNQKKTVKVKAKQYIDCTYEGDLMARSGVSYATGREDGSQYGETLNGVQISYWHQFPDNVDPYVVEGDPTSGYCWGIQDNKLMPTATGDKAIQAYNFRLCLTNNPANRRAFERPANYDPSKYELLARALRSMEPDINKYLLINWGEMPDDKYDVNNRGPLSTDMIGMNYEYPDGDYETRARIWQEHIDYTKGYLYFLANDERVPLELRKAVSEFGWSKDEFVDNDNFPTQLYVREARRMIGEYVMTQKNCEGFEVVSDGVGLAAYIMDSHNCQRIVVNGMVKNEGDVQSGGFPPYPISYRSIIPQRSECTNLFVPVCVSASHIAYGSIRMEPVFMVLAQSAAVAAVLAMNDDIAVQDVDVEQLNSILTTNPYLDGSTPEVLVDDSELVAISTVGDWEKIDGYYYKSSYTRAKTKKGVFNIKTNVEKAGKYEVVFYCSSSIPESDIPISMNLMLESASQKQVITLLPKANYGKWQRAGVYEISAGEVTLSIDANVSNGTAFFDAIILHPVN